MDKPSGISVWMPLINKLVWPVFIVIGLLLFHQQAGEIYRILIDGIKSGRSVEVAGIIKLGEAATETRIRDLSQSDVSIRSVGGSDGVVRKSSGRELQLLKSKLNKNPLTTINTLLVPDNIQFKVNILKDYVATLGLKYVVFQKGSRFDGWMPASTFVAQLPKKNESLSYARLKSKLSGISQQSVRPDQPARAVLEKMQALRIDSLPVVDESGRWLFFANRGEILARLMTSVILQQPDAQAPAAAQ